MNLKLQLLFFSLFIRKYYTAIVVCSNQNPFMSWVLLNGTDTQCDDDPSADYSKFKYTDYVVPILNGTIKFKVASDKPLLSAACGIYCSGCFDETPGKCIACSSGTRGDVMSYPQIVDLINRSARDCQCSLNMVEQTPPQSLCRCKASNYFEKTDDVQLTRCYPCQEKFTRCISYVKGTECAKGVGRQTIETSDECACQMGYIDYDPPQVDCKLACQAPCATCVGTSNTMCATCQDSLMTINQQTTCVCPSNYYMDATKTSSGLVDKNFCVLCHYSCATCAVSSTNCVTCSVQNNRIMASGTCPCIQYYYEVYGQPLCLPCQWSCATCSNSNSCATCVQNSNRMVDYATYQDYFCNCKVGFAEDLGSGACLPCIDTCKTCVTTTDTCTSCDSTKNRKLVNYNCVCISRYFDFLGDSMCYQCDPTCLTCNGYTDYNCLSCLSSSFRVLNNQNQCQCKQGYGYDYQMSEKCIKCTGVCLQCDYYDNCILCPSGINRILDSDNKCSCDQGFYEDFSVQTCKPCHYTCQTCSSSGQYNCLSCSYDMGRLLNNNSKGCDCAPGYYEFFKNCIPCYYTCLTCVSQFQDGCTSCPDSRVLLDQTQQNSQCICKSVSQIDDGKSLECTDCHYSCLTCEGPDVNNCLSCYDNSNNPSAITRYLKYGLCSCPLNWYDDQTNEICLKCHLSCETCFDSQETSCITCSDIAYRVQYANSCFCQDGYFENSNTLLCETCEYRCETCKIDRTNCLTCLRGSLRTLVTQTDNLSYKTCQCPSTAPNDVDGNPILCHFSCKNCTDKGQNQCTICDASSNRYFQTDSDGSYCLCSLQYYEIQTPECAQCSSYCLGCVNTAQNCTSCNPDQFRILDGNKCKCASRFGPQLLSYYDNGQDPECVACHYSCYTCDGQEYNQCLTCSDQDFRIQTGNQCACKPKYIDNGEPICMTCNLSCETCAGQRNLCTSCPSGSLRTLNVNTQSCDCPQGYFDSGAQVCEQCDIKCATCTNQSTTCLSCVIGSNRIFNQLSNSCDCLSGYYDQGTGICSICHYTCLQCSGPSSSECISCPDFTVTKRGLVGQSCICPDQFFDDQNNQVCQPCSSTCQTCQLNQNSCTQCILGQNRVLSGSQCNCQSSYYESGGPACSKCSNLCKECQISSTSCTQCDSSLNRSLSKSQCNCIPGYYDDGSLICKECHYSCLTCVTSDQNCISCDSNNFRQLSSNQCVCQNGTTDEGVALCSSCDIRCQTCSNIATQCLSCNPALFRVQSGYDCNCKDGYYENNIKQCLVCDENCLTCQNTSTACLTCDITQNRILDSNQKCICKNGYFADTNNICQQCSNKCQTCSQNALTCTTCFTDRTLLNNQCKCLSGYYDSASGCQRCSYSCSTCQNSATQCLSCDPISQRTLQTQQCICDAGYFDIGAFICAQCSQTCLTCISQNNNCQSCDNSLNRILNGSSCDCLPGYFQLNQDKQCQQCDISCKTCMDSSTKCTSCDISTSFRIDQSTTFGKCPCINGFYDDGTLTCKKCAYKCINCVGSQDNCTLCYSNPGYYRENILPACNCQAGYYDDGVQIICQKCSPKCQTCQASNTNCLVCESQSTRLTIPQCECKPGYFEDILQKCQLCSANCLTCKDNQSNCLTCQPDRITKECLCQDGYYEANQPLCQACSYKCSTCAQDPLNCLTCASDRENPPNCVCKYHLFDNMIDPLCQECDQYCGKCDLNGCIDCAGNRIKSGQTCICPIDSISYTFTPYCSNCDVAVIQGLFSDDLSQVIYTFEYELQFNFPLQVDVQAYCSYLIIDSNLKLLGQSPQCQIQEKTLIISLGSGSSVLVGDVIKFNSTILRHKNCNLPLQLIIDSKIQQPLQLLKPSIKINYPQVPVSPCASIDVRIDQQFVNGQRNLQLNWSSSLSISSLDQANQLQFQTLTIPSGQLPGTSEIDITITFTNFLNQSDSTTIKFNTLSASIPYFAFKTIKKSYFSWVPIKIVVYYANTICEGGKQTVLNNPVQIKFEEIVSNRQPGFSNAINFQQQEFNQDDSEGMISTIIPARSLSVNSNYSILSTFVDQVTNQIASAQLDIIISRSPLMVEIIGGTRIQNYLKAFKIEIQSKDPDIQTQWNQDPDITLTVECIDFQRDNKPCVDQYNKTVPLNKTSNIQYIGQRLFKPFTVLLFRVNCSKLNQATVTAQASIIMLDADLPFINVSYPAGYNIRDVNINEKLRFAIMLDQNQQLKDMTFSFALVYNFEIVHLKSLPNQYLTFAIWEGFNKFSFINQISVRLQAHDMRFLMPQLSAVMLTVNMPPVNSIITIQPQQGQALFTQYNFRVTNAKDQDSPIQYRFAYYKSWSHYQDDIQTGDYDNLIILQDFTTMQQYKSILESGNLTLLISVSDSQGSIVNYTYQIKSLSFYEQWQLPTEENVTINSSTCKNQVQNLQYSSNDPQQLMIAALELIKLQKQKIQKDCLQPIIKQLKTIQFQLFDVMLQQSGAILQSRISNVLAQIYELNFMKESRLLQQDQQICFNISNNKIQFNQLTQIYFNMIDNQETVKNISSISTQIQKAISQNTKLTKDYSQIQDIGDDFTARSLVQNQELRKSFLRILGGLFDQVHDQKQNISALVNQLMNSFQENLKLDDSTVKIQTTGFGLQLSKIGQQTFQKYLIYEEQDPDFIDFSSFTINRYIQLVKYKTNTFFYTNKFQSTFQNGTQILLTKETSKYKYKQSILPYYESLMYDPQIYVDNKDSVNLVKYLYQGKLAFNMGTQISTCNGTQNYDSRNLYTFVCSSFIQEQWKHESCEIEPYMNKQGQINFKCYCNQMSPLTLMIMNISNVTKSQKNDTKLTQLNIETFISIQIYENFTLFMIITCILSIIIMKAISRMRKQQIYMSEQQQRFTEQRQQQTDILEITKMPRMSTPLFKQNLKYLHEISRLIYINYVFLSFQARFLLTIISINLVITSIHVFNVVIKHTILSVLISVFITMAFQIIIKVLEGFLNGPPPLKMIGYLITILLNVGIISLNILINSSQYNPIISAIQTIIGLIILYGPIEIIIQFVKLKTAFNIYEQLKIEPMNPVTNLIYYFFQDEVITSIVSGESLY